MTRFVSLFAGLLLASVTSADGPDIELIASLRIPGDAVDRSGFDQPLEDGSPANYFGGLSGIDHLGGNRFVLLADRGAGDGAVSFPCRVHFAEMTVDAENHSSEFELVKSQLMSSTNGGPLVGSLTARQRDLDENSPDQWTAMDPEGIRRWSDGTFLVSEEYGPRIVQLDSSLRVTSQWSIAPELRSMDETSQQSGCGSFTNRGLEGLAVTPSGQKVVAAFQSPLVQDGRIEGDKCLGIHCRLLVFSAEGQSIGTVVYPLEDESTGISEILAIDEDRFLVLERDSKAGKKARCKKVFQVDLANASDVSSIDSLRELSGDVVAVEKTLFLDLQDPSFGLKKKAIPEKPEGICWGEPLADGRQTLWMCCDNDFDPSIETKIYCFAVKRTK